MYAQQPQYLPTAPRRDGMDVTAWALVALLVAIVCAGAGWAIARNGVMGGSELATQAELSAREGAVRGMQDGYRQGAASGRRDANLRAKLELQQTKRAAAQQGYQAGFADGRARAAARAGDADALYDNIGATGTSYDAAGVDGFGLLGSGAFDDVPGYSSSAFADLGYGAGASRPYGATSPLASSSLAGGY